MRSLALILIGSLLCAGIVAFIPTNAEAAPTWTGVHLDSDQWLYFEVGALDQGDLIKYGVRITTPDESVNMAIMDSGEYADFESGIETFSFFHTQEQIRSLENEIEVPYQQVWYFVVIADNYPWVEIDIEYYVEVEEKDDSSACGGVMFAGAVAIIGILGLAIVIKRR
jgi:hypothetical protein